VLPGLVERYEEFAGEELACSSRARFPLAPLLSLHVVDR
jgi:hypothetical protein